LAAARSRGAQRSSTQPTIAIGATVPMQKQMMVETKRISLKHARRLR
jgi:hypothetical protein